MLTGRWIISKYPGAISSDTGSRKGQADLIRMTWTWIRTACSIHEVASSPMVSTSRRRFSFRRARSSASSNRALSRSFARSSRASRFRSSA